MNTRKLATLATIGFLAGITATACATGTDQKGPANPTLATTYSQPADGPSPTDDPMGDPMQTEPESSALVPLGKPGNVEDGVTMTILKVKPNLPSPGGKSMNIGLLVDFHNTSGAPTKVANSFDYTIVDAEGQRYGSSYVYDMPGPGLTSSVSLANGRHAKGWMIYKQPLKPAGAVMQHGDFMSTTVSSEFDLGLKAPVKKKG